MKGFEWQHPIAGGNNTAMAESYYLLFKPLPVGHHTLATDSRASLHLMVLGPLWYLKVLDTIVYISLL
jgi:hypothetical protein